MTEPERMGNDGAPPETVEKLMSITRAEFEAGLKRLGGKPPRLDGSGQYVVSGTGGERQSVICSFEALPDAVLGGRMRLPRARVKLHLAALSGKARVDFVALFERTFQRGGG